MIMTQYDRTHRRYESLVHGDSYDYMEELLVTHKLFVVVSMQEMIEAS